MWWFFNENFLNIIIFIVNNSLRFCYIEGNICESYGADLNDGKRFDQLILARPDIPDWWLSKRSMTKIRFRYRTLVCLMVRMVIRRSIMHQKETRWSSWVQTTKWRWWYTWCRLQGWSSPNKTMWPKIKLKKTAPGVKSYAFRSKIMRGSIFKQHNRLVKYPVQILNEWRHAFSYIVYIITTSLY